MKRTKIYILSLLSAAVALNIGCTATMQSITSDARSMMNMPRGDKDTEALYSRVNAEDKRKVNDLTHELSILKKTTDITKLEEQRDDLQQERSELNRKRTELLTKETSYRVRLAKLHAIDRNKLGVRVDNIEAITDTHVDAVETQTKRLKLDGKVAILDVKIDKLSNQISTLSKQLENLENKQTPAEKQVAVTGDGY